MIETCQRLAEFADNNGILLEIRYTNYGTGHFMASLYRTEVRDKEVFAILASVTGRDSSPTRAVFDLAVKLQGENIVYRVGSGGKRKELKVPTLVCSHESEVI